MTESPVVEETLDEQIVAKDRDWGIIAAIFIGAFFAIISFLATISGLKYTVPFLFITISEILLFIAGLTFWRDRKILGTDLENSLLKKRYYMFIASLVLYFVGIFIWIFLYNSDALIEVTYITVIPFLLITIKYFNVFFEGSNEKNSANEENELLKKKSSSITKYKQMFVIPLIINIIGAISFFVFPWFSTTANVLNYNAYYNCPNFPNCDPTQFTTQSTEYYNFQNVGISRFFTYFMILLALIGSIILYISYKDITLKQSNVKLRIGMLILTATSFLTIMGLFSLYYYLVSLQANSAPPVDYFSIDYGLLLGIMLILISTAVSLNISRTIHKIFDKH